MPSLRWFVHMPKLNGSDVLKQAHNNSRMNVDAFSKRQHAPLGQGEGGERVTSD